MRQCSHRTVLKRFEIKEAGGKHGSNIIFFDILRLEIKIKYGD